jgi:hypothetical protein
VKINTESPMLKDVPDAVRATIEITLVPCGTCFTTTFYDIEDRLIRQDQHVHVEYGLIAGGVINS